MTRATRSMGGCVARTGMRYAAVVRRAQVVAAVVLLGGGTVHAAPWNVTMEAGAEEDTNVQRVETGPGLDTERVASGVIRVGGKLDRRARLAGGSYYILGSALARMVSASVASSENVMLFAAEGRYLHPIEQRPSAGTAR